jgi:hypothetical protein
VPYGVALDAGSEGEGGGALFPPVLGIVPDAAAVDAGVDVGVDVGVAGAEVEGGSVR